MQDYSLDGPSKLFGTSVYVDEAFLQRRIAELERTAALPGADLLERARWLADRHRGDEATNVFDELVARFPSSPLAADARFGRHRLELENALAEAALDNPLSDETAALRRLDALGREPFDFAVWATDIGRATVLDRQGSKAAHDVMEKALLRWSSRPGRKPATDLERDVTAIRDLVVRPLGDGIYAGRRGWHGYSLPARLPPFVVLGSDLRVKLPDGHARLVAVRGRLPGVDRALFFDATQMTILWKIIATLGRARSVYKFWNEFFPAGEWNGGTFETFPHLWEVVFLDQARTRAEATVSIGPARCTVVLEKRNGVWKALKLTNEGVS